MSQNVEKRGVRWRIHLWDKSLWDDKRQCQGKRVKETLPPAIKTKREAIAIQRQKQEELDRAYAGLTQSPDPSELSWIETAAKVLAEKKVRNGKPWFDFCEANVKRFAALVGDVAAKTVTTEQCREYILQRQVDGAGPNYIRKEIALFRAIFRRAGCSCWAEVPLPRKPPSKIVFFTPEQFAQLLSVTPPNRIFRYEVMVGTGVRCGEAWSITWGDVIFDQQAIIINNAQKGQGTRWPMRRLPLSNKLLATLKARYEKLLAKKRKDTGDDEAKIDDDRIFPSQQNWRRDLQHDCEKAGLGEFTPHDFRHTFCSWLAQAGVPLIKVRDLAGHMSIQTTEAYAHLCPHDNGHVIAALDAKCVPYVSQKPAKPKKKGDPKIA